MYLTKFSAQTEYETKSILKAEFNRFEFKVFLFLAFLLYQR